MYYIPVPIGRHSKLTLDTEFKIGEGEPRLLIILDVSTNPILDNNGNPIPLTDGYGMNGFKNESKSINRFGFSDPRKVAQAHNVKYVHPFILNNPLYGRGSADQKKYLENLRKFFKKSFGLDWSNVNETNIREWDEIIRAASKGKMFVSNWNQWWDPERPICFAGPDGDDMYII